MKRFSFSFGLLLGFILFEINPMLAQEAFNTGKIGVVISSYGRIRVFTPDTSGVQQIERISALVGSSANSVFDYQNDVDVEEATTLVTNPKNSDYEITGIYNNTYSSLPPDVLEKLSVMGWNNGNYFLVKMNILSRETNPFNAIVGLDIIPYIDYEYGYDTVTYNATNKIIRSHRGGTNVGYKLLSHPLTSLQSFEWYDGYTVDSSYWNWMNHGVIDPQYVSATLDGPVIITGQAPQTLAKGDSIVVCYAVSSGANEAEMIDNMLLAEQKYRQLTSVESDQNNIPSEFALGQNYPNPFNPSTKISYQLPRSGFVNLKIYNVLGKEVAILVNEEKPAGKYEVDFNAGNLSTGVYFYKLTSNNFTQVNKMLLVK